MATILMNIGSKVIELLTKLATILMNIVSKRMQSMLDTIGNIVDSTLNVVDSSRKIENVVEFGGKRSLGFDERVFHRMRIVHHLTNFAEVEVGADCAFVANSNNGELTV